MSKKCWNETGCKTMADYLLVYHKTDVLLETDVFKKLENNVLNIKK